MVDCLLYLEYTIKLHEKVDKVGVLLLCMLDPVIQPFLTVQKFLEGDKYVAVSLLVPYIRDLRDGLNNALDFLTLPAPADDPVEITARKAAVPCVEDPCRNFDGRCRNGENILV